VAEQYVDAFAKLAKEGTSVVVPGNVGDMGQMIATAMGVFKTVGQSQNQAKTVAGNLVKSGKQEESSNTSESAENKNEVVKSVLESFEKTQQKH
jgi:ribosomal protein L18E